MVAEILHAFPQVRVFDPDDYLCDSRSCYAVLDGKLLYLDSNHLSAAGATLLGHHFDF